MTPRHPLFILLLTILTLGVLGVGFNGHGVLEKPAPICEFSEAGSAEKDLEHRQHGLADPSDDLFGHEPSFAAACRPGVLSPCSKCPCADLPALCSLGWMLPLRI